MNYLQNRQWSLVESMQPVYARVRSVLHNAKLCNPFAPAPMVYQHVIFSREGPDMLAVKLIFLGRHPSSS
jgi:hypothetical protein